MVGIVFLASTVMSVVRGRADVPATWPESPLLAMNGSQRVTPARQADWPGRDDRGGRKAPGPIGATAELGHYPPAWSRFGGSTETAVDRHHVSRIELLRNRERPAPSAQDRAS